MTTTTVINAARALGADYATNPNDYADFEWQSAEEAAMSACDAHCHNEADRADFYDAFISAWKEQTQDDWNIAGHVLRAIEAAR